VLGQAKSDFLTFGIALRQIPTNERKAAMNEAVTTTTTLWDWLQRPPTIVIYRPDGQLSLDQLPNMASPDAVVCFTSMQVAKRFLKTIKRSRRLGKRREGFRAVNLHLARWLQVIRAEAKKGRTHLSIWSVPGDGMVGTRSVRIEDVLDGFEFAAKATSKAMEPWRWN
jgi:hypothetical protein